jgi:hypothetical protein
VDAHASPSAGVVICSNRFAPENIRMANSQAVIQIESVP